MDKKVVKTRSSNYGITETIRNVVLIVLGKIQYPTARLIRRPVTIRGGTT